MQHVKAVAAISDDRHTLREGEGRRRVIGSREEVRPALVWSLAAFAAGAAAQFELDGLAHGRRPSHAMEIAQVIYRQIR